MTDHGTRTRHEDAFLDKIHALMVERDRLQEENAYLSAQLISCQEN